MKTRDSEGPSVEDVGRRLNERKDELREVRERLAAAERERDKRRAEKFKFESSVSATLAADIKVVSLFAETYLILEC